MISVITVCFNSEKTIQKTIDSIIQQTTQTQFEYLIIDGSSNDDTVKIVERNRDKIENRNIAFKFISERDLGIYDAMNKGIELAEGDIVGILNSDDFYELDTLENIEKAIIENPSGDIYYGFLRTLMYDGKELCVYRYNYENYLGDLKSGLDSAAQHPTCFIRMDLYKRLGLYNLEYPTAADYDFLLRAKISGAKFIPLNCIISNFGTDGVSSKISDMLRMEQKYKTHFSNGLISQEQFEYFIKYRRFDKIRAIKSKLTRLIFGL